MATIAKQPAEIWFLYGIDILMIAARVFCRTQLVGWRGYQPHNYLVLIVTKKSIVWLDPGFVMGIRAKLWKKFGLCILFSLGFFCMTAAILRFVLILKASILSFTPQLSLIVLQLDQRGESVLWSLRKDCIGIFVGQAPMITPLFKRRFWITTGYLSPKTETRRKSRQPQEANRRGSYPLYWLTRRPNYAAPDPYSITAIESISESQEDIVMRTSGLPARLEPLYDSSNEIIVERRVDIEAADGTITVVTKRSEVVIGQKQFV
ncbi:unnamed protein product [Fusarium venenatum]|uniref:Uncharacterized protein n=1 Tax=Fusarium venenatum TaxID=56646 RepID=A0A2L2U1B6_9HYPO|nr:uncharacterized protein FVRRES_04327 [Fusarium venenatum]CEI67815.1 unnamed protein product [Fusarium venenatum]